MKLYVLDMKREGKLKFNCHTDYYKQFVVHAQTARRARRIAAERAGKPDGPMWLTAIYSSCKEITADADEGLITSSWVGVM